MIPILEVVRLEASPKGTFGVLKVNKEIFCMTLEPPDRENAPQIASIPAQQYLCKPHQSQRFGWTYQVMDVPGRSAILFHAGNVVADTSGCLLLGQYKDKLAGDRAVLNSGATFRAFMARMAGSPILHLTISECY